jgi:hypothetical protein
MVVKAPLIFLDLGHEHKQFLVMKGFELELEIDWVFL